MADETTTPQAPPPPTEAMMAELRNAQPRWRQEQRTPIPIRSPHLAEAGEVERRVWDGQVHEIGVDGGGSSEPPGGTLEVQAIVRDDTTISAEWVQISGQIVT